MRLVIPYVVSYRDRRGTRNALGWPGKPEEARQMNQSFRIGSPLYIRLGTGNLLSKISPRIRNLTTRRRRNAVPIRLLLAHAPLPFPVRTSRGAASNDPNLPYDAFVPGWAVRSIIYYAALHISLKIGRGSRNRSLRSCAWDITIHRIAQRAASVIVI